jgi:hypothetical protein
MVCDTETLRRIVNNPTLSPAQKARALSIEAENALPYPQLDAETQAALDARVICDMYEGHAPYKPRYVLPDYSVVLARGSDWLELPAPQTLDEAINTLMIAYHHVPSVTGMPVYIGQLDDLLLPFCNGSRRTTFTARSSSSGAISTGFCPTPSCMPTSVPLTTASPAPSCGWMPNWARSPRT